MVDKFKRRAEYYKVIFSVRNKVGILTVLGIRIRRIPMFMGLPDPEPDPLVGGMNPDPSLFS